MPTTTNDPAFMPTEGVSGQPQNTARRTDAIGAEIPVIVHASRYSAASRGAGKNLPPVHEETRTVIVFPTGAVVRLSASLTTGELVVLTNQQSGSDVICRVANVKAQAGIQNYVNLEFTQRAPSFWGAVTQERSAERQADRQLERPTERMERSEPSAPPAIDVSPEPIQRAPISVPASELISAVQAVTQLLGAVPAPTESVPAAPQAASIPAPVPSSLPPASPAAVAGSLQDQLQAVLESFTQLPAKPAAHSEATSPAVSVMAPAPQAQHAPPDVVQSSPSPVTQTAAIPARTAQTFPQDSPRAVRDESRKITLTGGTLFSGGLSAAPAVPRQGFTPPSIAEGFAQEPRKPVDLHLRTDEPSSDSKKLLLTIAAGVLLLIVGAAGGAVLFRQSRSSTPPQQAAPTPQVTLPMAGTQAPIDRTMDQPINSQIDRSEGTSKALLPAVATSADAPKSEPSFVRPAQTRTQIDSPDAKAATPAQAQHIVMGNLATPIAKRSAGLGSSEPPPALTGQAENLDGNTLFAADGRTSVPAPPPSQPTVTARAITTTLPKLVFSPNAPYPSLARTQNVQGTVVVDALVDTDGRVVAAKAISGPALLQQAAVSTVRTWKYQPAQQDGQPVAVHTQVNVSFRLQ